VSNVFWNSKLGWIAATLLLTGCASEPSSTTIDFHRDVAPIFKSRCLNCHGLHQQQGGLRLDEKTFALSGGLSGKKLIGSSANQSELLRRVTSEDPTIVMPKEGGRLSEQEVNSLRRWVDAQAPWPEKTPPSGRDEFLARYSKDLVKRLSVIGGEPKIYLLLIFTILVGISERIRRVPADNERWSRGLRQRVRRLCVPMSVPCFLLVVLGTVLLDVVAFTMRQSSELAATEQELAEANTAGESRPVMLNGARPTPLRPRGATGLGGTYYRGNDERNENLFNGGDYRTAVMRLSLIDEHDQPVAIGRPLSGSQLFVRLEIERAANATPALFTDPMMEVLLTRRTGDRKEPLATDEPAKLESVQTGERWAAKYRLGEFNGQSEAAINGVIYVYTNAQRMEEAVQGTLQYGIVVALRIRERTVQANSELWLGPILVPGNFQFPTPGRITLNEWLDTQPIPEIVGDNSTDPKLLGIPEHLEKGAKSPKK
jgi:hypothetical protein